jgi:rhamnosyltransferase
LNKVLVILASFNGEKFIEDQVNSILAQKEVELEIRIFDDLSSDSTCSILETISDKRVSYKINSNPSGSAALNFLTAIISLDPSVINNYDFVALSDQDDVWLDNKLAKAVSSLIKSGAGLYASNLTLWNSEDDSKKLLVKSHEQAKYDYLFEGASAGCTYVMKADLIQNFIKDISSVDLRNWIHISHDWLIYFYARKSNFPVFIDQNSYILYRIHSTNVHGHLNILSFKSFVKRFSLVLNGWYFKQISGFSILLDPSSIEFKIYQNYVSSWFSRLSIILRYNYKLMRSRKKFIKFFLLSIIPRILK